MRKGRLGEKEAALFSAASGGITCCEEENSAQEQENVLPLLRGIFYMKKARQPPRLLRCNVFCFAPCTGGLTKCCLAYPRRA